AAEYAFKHPLTQEVAYSSQLAEKRRRTHALVAQAIFELHGDKLDERAAVLAGHWEKAGDAWQAAEWHGRAGNWCGMRDPASASRHWHASWDHLLTIDQSAARDELLVRAGTEILNHGLRVGMPLEEITAIFEHSRHLAKNVDDVAA